MNKACSSQTTITRPPSPPVTDREPQHPSDPPTRGPIVPCSFYATSLAQDHRMDLATLSQAFNAPISDIKHLLNATAITLAERGCLNTASRSKVIRDMRYKAVIAAIHSIPFFAMFFDRSMKRYESFVKSMVTSIARLCDVEFRQWREKRREEGGEREEQQDIAGVSGTEGRDAAAAHLPTPPATPRKRTAMSSSAAKTTVPASKRGRRSATDILASPSKKLKKAKASKSKR